MIRLRGGWLILCFVSRVVLIVVLTIVELCVKKRCVVCGHFVVHITRRLRLRSMLRTRILCVR